jgi:hypothetical protein
MNGHAITAWLSVLYRRIESEAGSRPRQACFKARQSELSVYCIARQRYSFAAARSRMGCERMMCETELCETGRNRTMRENGRGDMVKQKDAKAG